MTIAGLSVGAASPVAAQTAAATATVPVNRAARDTWTPVMDVLKAQRRPVTDAQLARLAELPIEAVWGGLQGKRYQHCFVTGFQTTQPTAKLVGRALTMRYLPVRPDLQEAVDTLAKEGDWDFQYNVRAGEDAKAGDVIVVEQGGMVTRATFMGDVTGLGMKMAGVKGVIIDYLGSHASAMADQVGVEWNVPIRLGVMTVLPGDVVIADASGVLAFPPQLTDEVIKSAEDTVYTENFKREMMRSRKYRARDIYPKLSPELEKVFAEWQKTHQKEGVKPN